MPESQDNDKHLSDDESRSVLRLFQQIADLEDEEQRAALISAADLSEPSRERLDRMLHTLHDRSTLLDTPLPERSRYESGSDAADWIGREVHGFRLHDLLHEGSIASVYLARQSEPVERTVVIKLLRPDAP